MKNEKIQKLVLSALFAALAAVMTMVIQIPSPMQGYVNLGDCAVLLAAWILGPAYGAAAAGIGSMMADLLSGYAHYAPGTLIIKYAMALAAAMILRKAAEGSDYKHILSRQILGGILAEAVMVLGYFFYCSLFLGKGLAAASSIPGNIVQGVIGLITAVIVYGILYKSHALKKLPR